MLMMALLVFAGCGMSATVQPGPVPPSGERWVVAVLALEETPALKGATESVIYGFTGAQGSGATTAREIASAFNEQPCFEAADYGDMRKALEEADLTSRDAASLDDAEACRIGLKSGADMVVTGRLLSRNTLWFLFLSRSRIAYELVGLDTRTCVPMWTARGYKKGLLTTEERLSRALARRMAHLVAERLHP